MELNDETRAHAADTLRAWALDEELKRRVLSSPAGAAVASTIARRYIAGERAEDAIRLVRQNHEAGHRGSIECVGESVRDQAVADSETQEFLRLIDALAASGTESTISFDLSHVGSVVDRELGLTNALTIAAAAREAGTSIMISAEGSDRTDLVLDLYEAIADEYPETGVTIQARLHRSASDLERILHRPGPIRLVKGAFLESEDVALARDSAELADSYLDLAGVLLESKHRVNLATHDAALVSRLQHRFGDGLQGDVVEFEVLQGLGPDLRDELQATGHATREYVVYGPEWWLYVLNRMAEHPERTIAALADLHGVQL
ncbi:proline dehydrogenase family protein [Microbacterium sp. ISL-59]|uniref:proline dehydrogenase family protein n=1 Tax=Microbacterium sp. ISL-59 TaxID=2819159 RepID=UPI001BE89B5C|nr:proline dehydrogenase family protein [Microbacterium sp. ISL-59]MBT2495872.1 proline dehydrogenase family protein [Microbacterium sp. ISL-59]